DAVTERGRIDRPTRPGSRSFRGALVGSELVPARTTLQPVAGAQRTALMAAHLRHQQRAATVQHQRRIEPATHREVAAIPPRRATDVQGRAGGEVNAAPRGYAR